MAKFQITVPDGRQVVVDAANAQDAAEAADTWSNQGRSIPMQKAIADAQPIKPGAGGLMRSLTNGMTFNTAPELFGGLNAAGTGLKNLIAHATGQPDAGYGMGEAFDAARTIERNSGKTFSADHPVLNFGGNVTGSILNPANVVAGKYMAGAGSLPAAMVRGAVVGAPIGAAYGAGAGGPGGRARGATEGGIVGGVMGAAAPPLLAAGSAAVNAGRAALGRTAGAAQYLLNPPDPEAAASAADLDIARAKIAQLAQTKGVQLPVLADESGSGLQTTAEAIGRPGTQSLAALGRRSGTTGDNLEPVLADRAQGAPGRILNHFASATGIQPEEAAGNVESLVGRLQKEAGPLFDAIRADPQPVWNADLAKLAQRPVISKAIDAAGKSMLNAGEDPLAVGLKLDPDTGSYILGHDLSQQTEAVPTAATWDKVRKMVGSMVQRDDFGKVIRSGPVGITNGDLDTARRDLTQALAGDPAHGVQGAIPGYRAALDKGGDYLSMQDAFDRAQSMFLNNAVRAKDFASTYNGLSEPEQKAWASGMAAKLHDQMQAGRLSPKQLMQPGAQAKLEAVMGRQAAADFLKNLQNEAQLARVGGRMMPGTGSPTFDLLNASAEQEGGPGVGGLMLRGLTQPRALARDLVDAAASRATSPQVRNEMGRILTQPPASTADEFMFWKPPMKPGVMPAWALKPVPMLAGSAAGRVPQRK